MVDGIYSNWLDVTTDYSIGSEPCLNRLANFEAAPSYGDP